MTKEKNPHAVEMGRLGGKKMSDKKLAALKENAKKPRPNRKKKHEQPTETA